MAKELDFSGTWHSVRHFFHVIKNQQATTEHDLQIFRTGNQIVMQSLPNDDKPGAYLMLRLTLDGHTLTGTYHENSMPSGPFKGKSYYGALQMVVAPDGNSIKGKWVGLDTNQNIQNGEITITRNNT